MSLWRAAASRGLLQRRPCWRFGLVCLVLAVHLGLASHGLWHHHDEDHDAKQPETCEICAVLRGSWLPDVTPRYAVAAAPCGTLDQPAPALVFPRRARLLICIRGPPTRA